MAGEQIQMQWLNSGITRNITRGRGDEHVSDI